VTDADARKLDVKETRSLVRKGDHAATDDLIDACPRVILIVAKEGELVHPTGKRGGSRGEVGGPPEISPTNIFI
jgi:hypothetical protein